MRTTDVSRSASRFGTSSWTSRNRIWVWPVLAAVLLAVAGWFTSRSVERALQRKMQADLQTILNADVTALQIWLRTQESTARAIAEDRAVRRLVSELVNAGAEDAKPSDRARLVDEIRQELRPILVAHGYHAFVVLRPDRVVLASDLDAPIGQEIPVQDGLMDKLLGGQATVSRPIRARFASRSPADGATAVGMPTMFAAAPVNDQARKVIALLGLQIRPDEAFTRILSVARAGETGETFAFDSDGLMLSDSRFTQQLKQIGLLDADEDDAVLNVQLRDPQINLVASDRRAPLPRNEQPLTLMAAAATEGREGVNVTGYRDYRGVPVIGAWTWLPDYEMGVATEVDVDEAFRPVAAVRWAFRTLLLLVALSTVGLLAATYYLQRANRKARRAALEIKRLGQYALDEKIGAGAMGVVYRGHHDMLRRPTAVKLLDVDKTNEQSIARFEREVQLTGGLTHPNTIAIYDYGRTPEGVFYYAMEYLEGIDLDRLVKRHGALPDGRALRILAQAAGSLSEAHEKGLVHRDIKPANIFLTRCGGIGDFVKVLDFGLVKAVDSRQQAQLTMEGALTGTPLYLAPEAIESPEQVSPASDLYALACVGYFLLTGEPVFTSESIMGICRQHLQAEPESPSARTSSPIATELEALLLQSLAKSPKDRPASARTFRQQLLAITPAVPWTDADAEAWWQRREARPAGSTRQDALAETQADNTERTTKEASP